MGLSIFDLFKIGIGPSSSHTIGPMVAANRFIEELKKNNSLHDTSKISVELYGSLAMTGQGHATDTAIMLGLTGEKPDQINPNLTPKLLETIRQTEQLTLAGKHPIHFNEKKHLHFIQGKSLPKHPNGMTLRAFDRSNLELYHNNYYSVGGGFVLNELESEPSPTSEKPSSTSRVKIPFPFKTAKDLLDIGDRTGLTIAEIVIENEKHLKRSNNIQDDMLKIWLAMSDCIKRGCKQTGMLPGKLNVKRRAQKLHENLLLNHPDKDDDFKVMDWVNLYAIAVNEENASGSRVVTAPTNGAAGIIPAVLSYYRNFVPKSNNDGICTFLATSAAIGMLYKTNASISAAEVGCQGEIGVACSMAAAGLCAVMGGTNRQIQNAAEIAMEHNLGLTCDPIAGLVQIPCIERNTMGAIKAINSYKLAIKGDGEHKVSLDNVIASMYQTGLDMHDKYKETAKGGLAVNVSIC